MSKSNFLLNTDDLNPADFWGLDRTLSSTAKALEDLGRGVHPFQI